jgi:hypothetical protein
MAVLFGRFDALQHSCQFVFLCVGLRPCTYKLLMNNGSVGEGCSTQIGSLNVSANQSIFGRFWVTEGA